MKELYAWRAALGRRIVEEREAKGMTHEDLAFASGVPLRWLKDVEAGKCHVSPTARRAIAKGLRIDPTEFEKWATDQAGDYMKGGKH